VFDPLTIGLAFKTMQAAYDRISYCCEALSEGKVAIQKVKKATDDIKTITNDAKTIFIHIIIKTGVMIKTIDNITQTSIKIPR